MLDPSDASRIDWEDFLSEHWEQSPTVLRGVLDSPLITSQQLYEATVAASTAFRERADRERHVRVFVGGRQLQLDLAAWLPNASHQNLDAYLADKGTTNGFGLVVNEVQRYSPSLFFALRDFSSGLFQRTGLPMGNSLAVTFMGNYRHTAFGVHRDDYSNFQFVLSGRKRYRVWPTEVFGEVHTVDDPDYSRFLDRSIVLEGGPGDVVYWPASYYHVAETDGENAASIGFAVPIRKVRSWILETLERALPDDDGPRFAPGHRDPARLPAVVSGSLASMVANKAVVERTLAAQWLVHRSSASMQPPPPAPDAPLEDEAWVATDRRWPIVFADLGEVAVLCANGHALEMPPHPCIAAMIEALNDARPHRVGRLVADHQGDATIGDELVQVGADEARAVLEALYATRALSRVAPPESTSG